MEKKLETLSEVYLYLEKFETIIINEIEKIKEGNVKDVYNIIVQMSEGIEWLLKVFTLTEDVQVQKIDVQEMNRVISNIVDALENKDIILLKDT